MSLSVAWLSQTVSSLGQSVGHLLVEMLMHQFKRLVSCSLTSHTFRKNLIILSYMPVNQTGTQVGSLIKTWLSFFSFQIISQWQYFRNSVLASYAFSGKDHLLLRGSTLFTRLWQLISAEHIWSMGHNCKAVLLLVILFILWAMCKDRAPRSSFIKRQG